MRLRNVLLAAIVLVALAASIASPPARAVWPSPVFENDLTVEWNPLRPTDQDRVTFVIRTIPANTFIKGASVYLSITDPDNVTQGPYPNPMFVGDPATQATFSVRAYPNGTTVTFYFIAWDFDNDVVTSRAYTYQVQGAPAFGWRHPGFDENVEVGMYPPLPQPHDEVTVSIRSREPQVRIGGANLYLRYIYQSDPPKAGGFAMAYVNTTHLAAMIPGFPPGTEVIFWIIAWDKDVATITSPFYGYNLSVDKYTRHENLPFPPLETYVGTAIGLGILVPVAVYFVDVRRKRRSQG
ncbi:MAG: hypothetical protein E6K16_02680 [Methanobacteriota archaeon]|nr:MAG: hypothetical protein E6K16_02680 [Euryarchaeota archaeon]